MKTFSIEKITHLQQNPANIRNICILAHVDHGKTTLADTLVASNGIISQRMAGKLRYLDSREDEQIRGITMKSSAISLIFNKDDEDTLVNLIDSPGHIDFSSEVSTAVRLCEGAIVLVDVVEGVCPQTHAVLRQAWLENIKPVLVLNKIDRLILELKMSPLEAHLHLKQILEQVNAITAELFTSDVLGKTSAQSEMTKPNREATETEEQVYDWSSGLEETDDSSLYFSPDQGNVIFASAIDGWGFGINHFAEIYASKLGVNAAMLKKYLWGDFYLENKTKRIKKGAQQKEKKPLFVNFILENLWAVYEAVMQKRDKEMIEKIVKSLGLKIPSRDTRHSDARVLLQTLCSQWLPLAKAVLAMVVDKLPSPLQMEGERAEKLLCSRACDFETLPKETKQLKQAFLSCSGDKDEPVVIYVSKLFPVERKYLPRNKQRPLTQEQIAERRELARKRHAEKLLALGEGKSVQKEDLVKNEENIHTTGTTELIIPTPTDELTKNPNDQVFIAFARVFSGTLKKGQKLLVLGPKHDPAKVLLNDEDSKKYVSEFIVEELYLFMGRELEELEQISAGNIVGIGGLEDHILKSATLSNTLVCPSFCEMFFEVAPIVRVAVEPTNAGDIKKLNTGLKLLNQSDPCVEILIQETGEHVVIAAGEVHLQKCLDDLTERFAKIKVNVSSPIVPFRETIIPVPKFDRLNEAIQDGNQASSMTNKDPEEEEDEEVLEPGLIEIQTANRLCSLKIRALPLPLEVTKILEKKSDLIKILDQVSASKVADHPKGYTRLMNAQIKEEVIAFKKNLEEAFANSAGEDNMWKGMVDQIWCFGPRRNGPNILINKIPNYTRTSFWAGLDDSEPLLKSGLREFDYCISSGFQMATLSGPLCEESMYGVCFIIESWEKHAKAATLKERWLELKESSISREYKDENLKFDAGKNSTILSNRHTSDNHVVTESCNDDSSNNMCNPVNLSDSMDKVSLKENERFDQDNDSKSPPNSPTWQQTSTKDVYGPFSGQLMCTVKEGCRRAFQTQPQRLMWAMYTCVIQATADVLGKMYGVLSKRHGRILHEDMKEGSSIFNIDAMLPVVESFGFAEEIRKRTSGSASPQLKFSHWEVIDLDPFWVPTTEEEYMHFGEKADSENVARKYMNNIRRRKGLPTDDKLVEFGEKQRTLTKNK